MTALILAAVLGGLVQAPWGSTLQQVQKADPSGNIRVHSQGLTTDYYVVDEIAGHRAAVTYEFARGRGLDRIQVVFVPRDSYVDTTLYYECEPDRSPGIYAEVGAMLEDDLGLPARTGKTAVAEHRFAESTNVLSMDGMPSSVYRYHGVADVGDFTEWDSGATVTRLETNPTNGTAVIFTSKAIAHARATSF